MFFLRVLLLPFAFLFGIITKVRNLLFDLGIFRSQEFETKSISAGNITVGGTGKSPHIEYLITLLNPKYSLATLGRGYLRKNERLLCVANEKSTYAEIGDEPMQFHSKFTDVTVVVDEIDEEVSQILKKEIHPDIILLDDCYQVSLGKTTN